jgi:hypothetical protein
MYYFTQHTVRRMAGLGYWFKDGPAQYTDSASRKTDTVRGDARRKVSGLSLHDLSASDTGLLG